MESTGDYRIAFTAAEAFNKHAQQFICKVNIPVEESAQYVAKDIGGWIASATQLVFAIELYIKCLLLITGRSVPKKHNLLQLYEGLAEDLKKQVHEIFESQPKQPINSTNSLILSVHIDNFTRDQLEDIDRQHIGCDDYSLIAMLDRYQAAFSIWRYIYEIGKRNKMVFAEYDFHHLTEVATSFRQVCLNTIDK